MICHAIDRIAILFAANHPELCDLIRGLRQWHPIALDALRGLDPQTETARWMVGLVESTTWPREYQGMDGRARAALIAATIARGAAEGGYEVETTTRPEIPGPEWEPGEIDKTRVLIDGPWQPEEVGAQKWTELN